MTKITEPAKVISKTEIIKNKIEQKDSISNVIEVITETKHTTFTSTSTHTELKSGVNEIKFDVSKIRTDTLGKFDITTNIDVQEEKHVEQEQLHLQRKEEVTKEQIEPVIEDIFHKESSVVSAAKSPVLEKDIKITTKEIVESEKRSYDAKVPQKDERRHSCISPAISLERIAESEVETEEDISKPIKAEAIETCKEDIQTGLKKSDSAMKQMADNIEIIIKQASEDIDLSVEEPHDEESNVVKSESQDLEGKVSVDSIIEEAVNTVQEYFESKEKEYQSETFAEEIKEDTKRFIKERPSLMKSLSRDSGEGIILPKKKQTRTFSVQSSPEEVEEQIYTDSESGNSQIQSFFVYVK